MSLDVLATDPAAAVERLLPMERLLTWMPAGRLTDEGRRRVTHGQAVSQGHLIAPGLGDAYAEASAGPDAARWVRLLDAGGHLAALATADVGSGALHPAVVLI